MQFQKKWIAIVRRLGGVVSSSSDSHMISIRGNVTWSATTPAWRSSSFGMIRHNVLVVLFPAQNPGPPGTDIRSHREWFLRKDKKKSYWRCKMMKPKDYPHSPYMKQWAYLVLIHIDIEKKK
jgi:hypothetical protein